LTLQESFEGIKNLIIRPASWRVPAIRFGKWLRPFQDTEVSRRREAIEKPPSFVDTEAMWRLP
jgi:hypothetical protein